MASATNQIMLAELRKRGWQAELLPHRLASFIQLTLPNGARHYLYGAVIEQTSAVGMRFNQNKLATYIIAEQLDIPVANYIMAEEALMDEVEDFAESQFRGGYQLIVKPINTDHGSGITVGIKDLTALHEALVFAQDYSKKLIVQRRHYGNDCRLAVVDGVCVAATLRRPPTIVGDGAHTIAELISLENERRLATNYGLVVLQPIKPLDVERYLGAEAYESVLAEGQEIQVSGMANFGRGGVTEDVTDIIHPTYGAAAVRLAQELGLMSCGIDFLTEDCTQPLSVDTAILLEVNCAIGLRLHHYPTYGKPRDVAAAIVDAFEKYSIKRTDRT